MENEAVRVMQEIDEIDTTKSGNAYIIMAKINGKIVGTMSGEKTSLNSLFRSGLETLDGSARTGKEKEK